MYYNALCVLLLFCACPLTFLFVLCVCLRTVECNNLLPFIRKISLPYFLPLLFFCVCIKYLQGENYHENFSFIFSLIKTTKSEFSFLLSFKISPEIRILLKKTLAKSNKIKKNREEKRRKKLK